MFQRERLQPKREPIGENRIETGIVVKKYMSGKERREEIIRTITASTEPVSGTALAVQCGVSRQVIVQDIALIRAAGYDVIATNRGYLCHDQKRAVRVFKVYHTDEQMQDELNTIVDFGGTVLDVFVHHEVYGELRADLSLSSRMRVGKFMEGIYKGTSKPLKDITSGLHFHTVSADSERTLDLIEEELKRKGYLV